MPQTKQKTFGKLKIGDRFIFASEIAMPHSGMAKGPWVKISKQKYRHDTDRNLWNVKVGTLKVEVIPLDPVPDHPEKPEELPERAALFATIRPGSRVTVLSHAGTGRNGPEWKRATGRAVIVGHQPGVATLNMGGQHGTPGIATPKNVVAVTGGNEPKDEPEEKEEGED